MIRFMCPKCKMVMQVADQHQGAVVGCPTCKHPLKVPAGQPAASAITQPSQVPAVPARATANPAGALTRSNPAPAANPVSSGLTNAAVPPVSALGNVWVRIAIVAGGVGAVLFLGAVVLALVLFMAWNSRKGESSVAKQSSAQTGDGNRGDNSGGTVPDGNADSNQKPPIGSGSGDNSPKPRESKLILDRFGNPTGNKLGLADDGEFTGKKIVAWCGDEAMMKVVLSMNNPMWKSLNTKGFTIQLESGRFRSEWLQGADQLWIFSTSSQLAQMPFLYPDYCGASFLDHINIDALTEGWTRPEVERLVNRRYTFTALDETAYTAIEKFVRSGKGLYLLADNVPFTAEADTLAQRLFGATIDGDYQAEKIAYVKARKLSQEDLDRFPHDYEIADHPLLTGVNFLYEGITVSNIGPSDKLQTAILSSDDKPLMAVSRVKGQRVVIDCGFTRYYYGPADTLNFVTKTAGTIRLAENVAAYLMGKGEQ